MKYFSMFSGTGGFEYGIDRATNGTWKCVGYSEIDKYAIKTYEKHYSTHKNFGDATKINPDDIPDCDLICAGFPCQSFSLAGKRGGFADVRGTLFFEIMRVARHKRVSYLFLENVKGLLSHDAGWTFATILNTLDECGYDAEWQVLNSKFFGVPQNRERVFIVASLRGKRRLEVFPFCQNAGAVSKVFGEKGVSEIVKHEGVFGRHQQDVVYEIGGIMCSLPAGTHGSTSHLTKINDTRDESVICSSIAAENVRGCGNSVMVGQTLAVANCLDANMGTGVTPEGFFEKGKRNVVFQQHSEEDWREFEESPTLCARMGTGGNNVPMVAPTIRAQHHNTANVHFVPSGDVLGRLRRLTPVECERLQGFPDGWTIGSDTQRYKQCGNAVTVNVIQAIVERMVLVRNQASS